MLRKYRIGIKILQTAKEITNFVTKYPYKIYVEYLLNFHFLQKESIFQLDIRKGNYNIRNNFSIEITKMNILRSKNSDIAGLIFK